MRALLVVNPMATATTGRARDILLHALGAEISIEVAETGHRGHAITIAAAARADGVDLVVALGGDGTVNEVVNGLLAEGRGTTPVVPTLAVVPGGSANVFGRALGFARDSLEATSQVLDAIRADRTRTVGLGRVGERWFTFNAGFGFDAEVIELVEKQRTQGREATPGLYVRSALAQFTRHTGRRHPSVTLQSGAGDPVSGLYFAIVANASPWTYFGPRAVNLLPEASFDAGLDLLGVRSMNSLTMAAVAARVAASRRPKLRRRALLSLHDLPEFTLTSTTPRAVQVDGDFLGHRTSVTFTAEPGVLRVLAGPPAGRAGRHRWSASAAARPGAT